MRLVTVRSLLIGLAAWIAGCTSPAPDELVLMTHDSFAISEETLEAFEEEAGVEVRILLSGDAGQMLNQAILTKDNPLADVLFGVDNTFLSRALDEDLFVPYASPGLEQVPDFFQLDPEHRVTPIDYGDVCLNYDKEGLEALGLNPPSSLEDLTNPSYSGMLVVENPATSSPGLAFLLATVGRFGESGSYTWVDYWADLRDNDALVTSGWEEAYYGVFSGGSGEGDRPLVVSYASSPPAEVYFADPQPAEPPTGVVQDGCFRQIEFAGILRGTQAEPVSKQFIDFMLTEAFQEDIPLNMFVFPVTQNTELPEVFARHALIPADPVTVPHEEIGQNRERWIEEWTSAFLG